MSIDVKLQVFEGPLDLLLHLIEKNQVNIYDIPIVTITEQYLEYLGEMQRQDLDVMSEFLVMAATLINIKAKMLRQRRKRKKKRKRIHGQSWYGGYWSIRCTSMLQQSLRIWSWMPQAVSIDLRQFQRR